MGLQYYIDSSLPSSLINDLVTYFERLVDKCPSDALLNFYLLSVGGKLCLDVTLNSATMHFKESLESRSYKSIKRSLEQIFKSRIEGWRTSRNETSGADPC